MQAHFRAATLSLSIWACLWGTAHAGPVDIFDSLSDAPPIHPETIFASPMVNNPEGASFVTPGYIGGINSLTLDLNCSKQNGQAAACGAGSYTFHAGDTVATGVTNSNTVTLNSVAGITVGAFVANPGSGIATGTVYVTAINGNTLTLSKPITISAPKGLEYLSQGSFTVGLYADSAPLSIPGAAGVSTNLPSGTPIATFTVYDASLYVQNPAIATTGTPAPFAQFVFSTPFSNVELAADTPYWIKLSSGSALDPTNTNAAWEFLTDNGGTGVTGNYWTVASYDGSSCVSAGEPSGTPACSYRNGSTKLGPSKNEPPIQDAVFGMDVTYVPEPGTLALVGGGMLALGLIRGLRRRGTA